MSHRFEYNGSVLLKPAKKHIRKKISQHTRLDLQAHDLVGTIAFTEFDFDAVVGVAWVEKAVIEKEFGVTSRPVVDQNLWQYGKKNEWHFSATCNSSYAE